ncbi:MAG: hypothetical protein ABSD49_07885 [Candidatus Bathyarchaeia archaeon]
MTPKKKHSKPQPVEKKKHPGQPKKDITCPKCGKKGGTLYKRRQYRKRNGNIYYSYPWIVQHHKIIDGKRRRVDHYLGVNYKPPS